MNVVNNERNQSNGPSHYDRRRVRATLQTLQFAATLRRLAERRNLTMEQIAEHAQVSPTTVKRIASMTKEQDIFRIRLGDALMICTTLGVSIHEMMRG